MLGRLILNWLSSFVTSSGRASGSGYCIGVLGGATLPGIDSACSWFTLVGQGGLDKARGSFEASWDNGRLVG